MTEQNLRSMVREKLAMVASPHQHPRDALAIAKYIRSSEDTSLVVRLIREEAGRLHINVV